MLFSVVRLCQDRSGRHLSKGANLQAHTGAVENHAFHRADPGISAIGMALVAVALGFALMMSFFWLTVSVALCIATLLAARRDIVTNSSYAVASIVVAGIVIQTLFLLLLPRDSLKPLGDIGVWLFFALGVLQILNLKQVLRRFLMTVMALLFVYGSVAAFRNWDPHIDVYDWQQTASSALLRGTSPYTARIRNSYGHDRDYGPGVVDPNGVLTYGFPYPPLSLLMVSPGFLLGGDVRYADAVAIGLSALLMAAGRAGSDRKLGALAGALSLTTPMVFYVIKQSWTEPLLVLTFSAMMFCACRYRKALPWALGLFLSTKQYAVLTLPLIPLLTSGPEWRAECRNLVLKAGLVVAALNLPFLLWNPHEFIRAVVVYQFVQPFRTDSLSYLVWISNTFGLRMMWLPWVLLWQQSPSPFGISNTPRRDLLKPRPWSTFCSLVSASRHSRTTTSLSFQQLVGR